MGKLQEVHFGSGELVTYVGYAPVRLKCSNACAEAFVPFFMQCEAASYPASSVPALAALSTLCLDRHPNAGGGGGH